MLHPSLDVQYTWMNKCYRCELPPVVKRNHSWMCQKHLTLANMRTNCRSKKKKCPSPEELDAIIPSDMKCPHCLRAMAWCRKESDKTNFITLQHNRSGSIQILCMRCNSRHLAAPGDSFYEIPDDHKFCCRCQTVKPRTEFHFRADRPGGNTSYCKPCNAARRTGYVYRNKGIKNLSHWSKTNPQKALANLKSKQIALQFPGHSL